MSNAWSHLPNAHHIDWVLKSVRENPELWSAARGAARVASWGAARGASWDAARGASWDAAMDAAWLAARLAARGASSNAASNAARDAVWDAARDVISALIAYDDCDQFLSMSYEKLRVWDILSEDPRAVLLLPMVYVKEKLANLTLQPA
jgi:hypothetical protein